MRSQDHSQCSSRVVQGELLPKIDDDIDTVLGLAVFYQYVLSAALNQPQTQYVSVFSTELFAYYLIVKFQSVMKCLPVTQTSSRDILQRYMKCISETRHTFISDIILYKSIASALKSTISTEELVNCGRFYRLFASETETNTLRLATLLQKSAVEHLTTCRLLEVKRFGL